MHQTANVDSWLETNRESFKPPICAKLLYGFNWPDNQRGQLKVMFVGAPNERKDYHVEAGEELFYMWRGNMKLPIMAKGKPRTMHIREGEFFLLPARTPHSPQRPEANSIGLVIERERESGNPEEVDCLRYYVEGTDNTQVLWEDWFYCECLESLGSIVQKFKQTEEFKTGKPTSTPTNRHFEDSLTFDIEEPLNFEEWLTTHNQEIQEKGSIFLYQYPQTSVQIFSKNGVISGHEFETLIWQYRGESSVTITDNTSTEQLTLKKSDFHLAKAGAQVSFNNHEGGLTIVIIQKGPVSTK